MKPLAKRILCALVIASLAVAQRKPRELKPGFNFFSRQQDVAIGKEYAAQVEQQLPLVRDAAVNEFINRIGRRLASTPEAGDYPYTFKVVQDKSINAFALPGGPTFTHTGLMLAAENEAQIAGVLAHEIAHVALRHGTSNASKANLIQIPAMIAGEVFASGGGWRGMLAQLGVGLGANSVLLKFSRNAERDADLLGTRMMARAGYNPIEMARFFEKLEAESGRSGRVSQFFSDHPNPGNRVKAVQDEILLLPRSSYSSDVGELPRVKQIVQGLPDVKRSQRQGLQGGGDPRNISGARPSGRFREYRGRDVYFQYPDNWEILSQDQQTGEITIASRAGLVGQGISYGLLVNQVTTQRRGDLLRDTEELVRMFQQRDQNLRVTRQPQSMSLRGQQVLATRMEGPSGFEGTNETLLLVTLERPGALFYMLFIVPQTDWRNAQPVIDQMVNSLQFPN